MPKLIFNPLLAAIALASPSLSYAAVALEEIVVTAQKREETLQNVPISITAKSGAALQNAGIGSIKDLESIVPGLHVGSEGAYSNPTIRGVGSKLAGTGISSNVATYVDGFYRANSLTSNMEFLDVESLQVLKGPQGTLFGRNATGGAILVTTKTPDIGSDMQGTVKVGYGSYNDQQVGAYISGGLTDTAAGSVMINYHSGDGFVENIVTNDDEIGAFENTTVRTKLALEPTDTSSYIITLDYSKVDDPSNQVVGDYAGWSTMAINPATAAATVVATQPHETSIDMSPQAESDSWGIGVKGVWDLGDSLTLTSYTQYRDEDTEMTLDNDGTNIPAYHLIWRQEQKTFTQEFNLNGVTDTVDWVAGVFYMRDKGETPAFEVFAPGNGLFEFTPYWNNKVDVDALAVFGDATFNVIDRLYITVGLRYSEESSKAGWGSDLLASPFTYYDKDWESVTGRLVARYEMTDDTSVYLSLGNGFKSGLWNANAASQPLLSVDPEEIIAWELGLKTEQDSWRADVAAFYYDYSDLHVSEWYASGSIVKNAAEAEIYGLEMNLTAIVTDNLTITTALAYTHSEYTDYENANFYSDPVGSGTGLVRYPSFVDVSGEQMLRTPELSGSLSLDYYMPIESGEMVFNLHYAYTDDVSLIEAGNIIQESHSLINGRITWDSADQVWKVAVYGKNLTDEEYVAGIVAQDMFVGQTWGAPRTFGVEASYQF